MISPITRCQILDSSKLKEFANDNFKFDKKWQKVIQMGRKHCGKKGKFLIMSNFSFSHSVFKRLVSQGLQKASLSGNGLRVQTMDMKMNVYPLKHNVALSCPSERRLLKSYWEKKKILITSIFSFSHNVFNLIQDKCCHLGHLKFVIYQCFQFGPV